MEGRNIELIADGACGDLALSVKGLELACDLLYEVDDEDSILMRGRAAELLMKDQIESLNKVIGNLQRLCPDSAEGETTTSEIKDRSIEVKDYSIELSMLINRLGFVGLSLEEPTNSRDLCEDALSGAGSLILDIADKLSTINRALYGPDEGEEIEGIVRGFLKARKEGALVDEFLTDLNAGMAKDISHYTPKKKTPEIDTGEEGQEPIMKGGGVNHERE